MYLRQGITEVYLGIDPGVSGAYAIIDRHAPRSVSDFTDFKGIYNELKNQAVTFAYLEEVHIVKGSNAKSAKTFMANFGGWIALLNILDIPYLLKGPTIWQAATCGAVQKISIKDITDKKIKDRMKYEHKKKVKAKSIEFANRYWRNLNLKPSEDGKADALNMAIYAMKYHLNQF